MQHTDGLLVPAAADNRRRRVLPAATAGLALGAVTAWGLGLEAWPLSLAFGSSGAVVFWALTLMADRAARLAGALFITGLHEGGLEVRRARCRGDWFGNVDVIEFDTPLGTGWVRGDSKAFDWCPPGSSARVAGTRRWLRGYAPQGELYGRLIGGDWRMLMREAGRVEGRKLATAAQGAAPVGRQGFPPGRS